MAFFYLETNQGGAMHGNAGLGVAGLSVAMRGKEI
jgi:hypothetical protein